jgi:hypothetical protein
MAVARTLRSRVRRRGLAGADRPPGTGAGSPCETRRISSRHRQALLGAPRGAVRDPPLSFARQWISGERCEGCCDRWNFMRETGYFARKQRRLRRAEEVPRGMRCILCGASRAPLADNGRPRETRGALAIHGGLGTFRLRWRTRGRAPPMGRFQREGRPPVPRNRGAACRVR